MGTVDAPDPASPDARPSDPGPAPDRRSRRVLVLTTVASVLVMGGLVALALGGGGPPAGGDAPPAASDVALSAAPRPPELPAGCVPDRERPPRLVVDLPAAGVDFGPLRQGQVVEREVAFRNAGTGVLCLLDQGTPCGCVKLALKDPTKRRFEPGERGTLVLTLSTEGHQGLQKKSFWLYTNEVEDARRTWPVTADISLGVVTDSATLAFGSHRRGEPATTTLRLSSPATDGEWQVTGLEVTGPRTPGAPEIQLTYEAVPWSDATHRGWTLTVRHPGLAKEGLWQSPVLIRTTHPDRKELALSAYFEAASAVRVWPSSLVFGFIVSGSTPTPRDVQLLPLSKDVAFHVRGARIEPLAGPSGAPDTAASSPGFTCEVLAPPAPDAPPPAPGLPPRAQHPVVRVSYDGRRRAPGSLEAVLVIDLDLPDLPEVRVPVRGTVTEKPSAGAPAGAH